MATKSSMKKIPWLAMAILAMVIGVAIFAWNTFQKGAAKPLNAFYLPIALAIAGVGMFFFKPTRKVALPVLLSSGAILGVEAGKKASTMGMSRPSVYRIRNGQNRPAASYQDRPAAAMNGNATVAIAGSRAWG